MAVFEGFDFSHFWEDSPYTREEFNAPSPSDEDIAKVESVLGYKLPESYIYLMKQHNGGIPLNTAFACDMPTSWATDHIAINSIFALSTKGVHSIAGELGTQFMVSEWGYPALGVAICDCPSAGHDMVFLDYRECGSQMEHGEPKVVHIDLQLDGQIAFLADTFEDFIRGLRSEESFDEDSDQLRERSLEDVLNGPLWPELKELLNKTKDPIAINYWLRSLARGIVLEKQCFILGNNQLSHRIYDILLFASTQDGKSICKEEFLELYHKILNLAPNHFTAQKYDPSLVNNWIDKRLASGEMIQDDSGKLRFSEQYYTYLERQIEGVAASLPDSLEDKIELFFEEGRHRQIIEIIELQNKRTLKKELKEKLAIAYSNVGDYVTALELFTKLDRYYGKEGKHLYRKGFAAYYLAQKYRINKEDIDSAVAATNCFEYMQKAQKFLDKAIDLGLDPETQMSCEDLLVQIALYFPRLTSAKVVDLVEQERDELESFGMYEEEYDEQMLLDAYDVRVLCYEDRYAIWFNQENERPFVFGKKITEAFPQVEMTPQNWFALINFTISKNDPKLLENLETDPYADTFLGFYIGISKENEDKSLRLANLILDLITNDDKVLKFIKENLKDIKFKQGSISLSIKSRLQVFYL